MSRKIKGAYYTPKILTDFIVKHLMRKLDRKCLSILEPSVGDGSFINALHFLNAYKSLSAINFVGIEKEAEEIQKAKVRSLYEDPKISFEFITGDFLDVSSSLNSSFDLVIGNPPYIKKTLLQRTQIEKCNAIHKSAGLAGGAIKNIWPAFLIRSCQLLNEHGMLAMVLPSDLLQVGFSAEIFS
jgi:adenine-specific DNA-methyltransferase